MVATLGDRYTEFLTPSQACLSGVSGCRIQSWWPRWATATPSSSRPRRHAFQGFLVLGFSVVATLGDRYTQFLTP